MRVLLATENYKGKILRVVPNQNIEFDYVVFNENVNIPYLDGLSNELKVKFIKSSLSDLYPDYDYYIWIDSNIQVKSKVFLDYLIDLCYLKTIGAVLDSTTETVAKEYDRLLKNKIDCHDCVCLDSDNLDNRLYNDSLFIVNNNQEFLSNYYSSCLLKNLNCSNIFFSNAIAKERVKNLYWEDITKYCIVS